MSLSMIIHDILRQDFNVENTSHGWIQWKGTDVCMDVHCKCGYSGHVDSDFFYYFECPMCHSKYAVGSTVKLIELTEEQSKKISEETVGFKTCPLEDI